MTLVPPLLLLQALLLLERQASDAGKKAYAEAQERNNELAKKGEDAETKVDQLQETVQRF